MPIAPVARGSLSDAVFTQLRDRILSGEFASGTQLPPERELCTAFGVNRGVLREALKRLDQLNLVQVRHGGATRTTDFLSEAGLELMPVLLLGPEAKLRRRAVRGLLEMRSAIGPDMARLAAERRTDADLQALEALVTEMAGTQAPVSLQRASMRLWERLALASDNLAYRFTYNSMRRAWEPVQDALAHALSDEIGDLARYRKLVLAVRERDGKRAEKLARGLLDAGFASVDRFLGGLSPE